jgi:hypothetical protein
MLFVDTDHGFLLARAAGWRVARAHGDGLDRLAWEANGRPRAFDYRYDFQSGRAELLPRAFLDVPLDTTSLRIEGESLWPPRAQTGGHAWPTWRVPSCASRGKALELVGSRSSRVVVPLPRAAAGRDLTPHIVRLDSQAAVAMELRLDGSRFDEWEAGSATEAGCERLRATPLPGEWRSAELILTGRGWALDALDLSEIH